MNILFCGDANIAKGIYMAVLSICKHMPPPDVYILTASIAGHKAISRDFATSLEKATGCKVFLRDVSDEFSSYLPLANMRTRFTPMCMLRLFADRVAEIPDKILYLDADVLCRGDFSEFYNTDISSVEICGVPDRYGRWFFGHSYLNSGVLLMNMANIRKSGLFEKCRALCREKRMFMPDQSALNKLAVKKKAKRKYNEQGKIKNDTVFKHFTTFFRFFPYIRAVTVKPWDVKKLHSELNIYEFDDIIRRYENEQRDTDILHNR